LFVYSQKLSKQTLFSSIIRTRSQKLAEKAERQIINNQDDFLTSDARDNDKE
jgi:hypothetical protein